MRTKWPIFFSKAIGVGTSFSVGAKFSANTNFYSNLTIKRMLSTSADITTISQALIKDEKKEKNSLLLPLQYADPEIFSLIEEEKHRQRYGIELIASENYTSQAVLDALGSVLTNKYSEGLPGARYYGGNEIIDKIELLCQKRALEAFSLSPEEWGVNVQPYSGSTANFAAYTAVLSPHDRVMGLDLPSGGHLTHGYRTVKRKVSSTSIYFESLPYKIDNVTGLIDYASMRSLAKLFLPKLIICGASAYPREFDYLSFRQVADEVGAYLLADIAHTSGLIASSEADDPFKYCDIVTTTTHKTLRGPRAAMIFYRKKNLLTNLSTDLEMRVNQAVFPGCQGGPHNNAIAAIAVALKQVMAPEFKEYCIQLKRNCSSLCDYLKSFGYKLQTDGTDNHLLLWDLRPIGLNGSKYEKVCELIGISINKNTVLGDTSAMNPGGVRLGTAAITTRGFKSLDIERVAMILHRAVQLSLSIQSVCSDPKDFNRLAEESSEIKQLQSEVEAFSGNFIAPGQE